MDIILQVIGQWEWLLLVLVVIVEVRILIKMSRERRERDKLIAEMQTTRVELGRESYLTMMKGILEKANSYVYFVSNTLTSTMSEMEKESIYRLYKSNVDHRCITGKDPGKIRFMLEQKRKGVQVRVNDVVMVSTFRYHVFDDRIAVLGFVEHGDAQSRKGILIDNPYFCRMLKDHFIRTWQESLPLEEYVREFISTATGTEVGSNTVVLASEWGISREELEELMGNLNGSS